MINLLVGDRVIAGDELASVMSVKDDIVWIMFDNGQKCWSPIKDLKLTEIGIDRWRCLSSSEMIEYLGYHPELEKQWLVSWIGVDKSGKIRLGQDWCGAVETLIMNPNVSQGRLAELFSSILLDVNPYLSSVSILNFWEV